MTYESLGIEINVQTDKASFTLSNGHEKRIVKEVPKIKPYRKDEKQKQQQQQQKTPHSETPTFDNPSASSEQSPKLAQYLTFSEKFQYKKKGNSIVHDQAAVEAFDLRKSFIGVDKVDALDHASLRLKSILQTNHNGYRIPDEILNQNLDYCITVMESAFHKLIKIDSYGTIGDTLLRPTPSGFSPVSEEIRTWIEETFTKKKGSMVSKNTNKLTRSFRAVVKAVQASKAFDQRIVKSSTDLLESSFSSATFTTLQSVDKWQFNIFDLDNQSYGEVIKSILYKLFLKYQFLRRFKIPPKVLTKFAVKVQKGYSKHLNRYHNAIHAADVTQTLHCLLNGSGLLTWLTDVEVFAMIVGAAVHDIEHTGTTNGFHVSTRSNLAVLYNDRSVLEHHHASTAFRIMQDQDSDIMKNFTKEEYLSCRTLIIELILATDMSHHFDHIKQIELGLEAPRWMERSKVLCLIMHAADLNHPSKPWKLHYSWTERLMIEFFAQGDKEKELELPVSPLCDRETSKVAQSQIGFIQFIMIPTFTLMFSVFSEALTLLEDLKISTSTEEASQKGILKLTFDDFTSEKHFDSEQLSLMKRKLLELREACFRCMFNNNEEWMKRDKIEQELKLFGEKCLFDYPPNYTTNLTEQEDVLTGQRLRIGSIKLHPFNKPNSPKPE